MSSPRLLGLPPGVLPRTVETGRGAFATLQASPDRARPVASPTGALTLLVPGWTGSKEDFVAILQPLADAGFSAVAFDQRGQYETPGVEDPAAYTIDALADDAAALAAALGGPVHLVGHSFGGIVARVTALRHPRLVRSLTLLCSGPAAIPGDRRELLTLMAAVIAAQGLGATWAAKQAYDRSVGVAELPQEVEAWLERRFHANHPVSLREITLRLVDETDRVDELARSGVPVLVAYGEADDGWPPAEQVAMARRIGAPSVAIPGAAHSPATESPQALVDVLTGFWSTLAAGDARG